MDRAKARKLIRQIAERPLGLDATLARPAARERLAEPTLPVSQSEGGGTDVSLDKVSQVTFWTTFFDLPRSELIQAVRAAGHRGTAINRYLGRCVDDA